MNNKPKYNLFKNSQYAIDGFMHAIKTELSFRIEFIIALVAIPIIILTPFLLWQKIVLFVTYFIIMIVELLNSSIENTVDLVTQQIHPLAKSAKDIGACAVLFSVILHISCWVVFLL